MPDPSILRAFGMLIAVVAVLSFILYMVKRINKKTKAGKNQIDLQILSRLALSQKNNLYLVKVGNDIILIGANDHHISTLSELETNSEDINKSTLKTVRKNVNTNITNSLDLDKSLSFGTFLKSAFKKNDN